MNYRHILITATSLSLSACGQSSYEVVPAAADYYSSIMPTAITKSLDTVALCTNYKAVQEVTILLKDGTVYEYEVPADGAAPVLTHRSTRARRDYGRGLGYEVGLGCIGTLPRGGGWMTEDGEYRFEYGMFGLSARVDELIVRSVPFDEPAKARLRRSVRAVEDAVKQHENFVPVERTWGLEP